MKFTVTTRHMVLGISLCVPPDDIWPQYEREGAEEPEWLATEREHFSTHRSLFSNRQRALIGANVFTHPPSGIIHLPRHLSFTGFPSSPPSPLPLSPSLTPSLSLYHLLHTSSASLTHSVVPGTRMVMAG